MGKIVSEWLELAVVQEAAGGEGRSWEVVILGPEGEGLATVDGQPAIKSKNGRYYLLSAVRDSVPLWDRVKVFDNHLTDAQWEAAGGMRSVAREWVGVIVEPRFDEATGRLIGVLKLVDDGLRAKLAAAREAGVIDAIGLSIDALADGEKKPVNGQPAMVVRRFVRPLSVDVVANPGAGGRLVRMIAAESAPNLEEVTMPDQELDEKKIAETAADLALKKLQESQAASPSPAAQAADEALKQAREILAKAEMTARLAERREALGARLAESGLPESFRALVRGQFDGRDYQDDELKAAIEAQRAALTPLMQSGQVRLPEGSRIEVSAVSAVDRYELALMRLLMGPTRYNELMTAETARYHALESVRSYVAAGKPALPRALRLSEWYYDLTGDLDGLGRIDRANARVSEANVTTSTLTSIVKNALNVMLSADYAQRQQWWDRLVRNEDVDTIDQATLVRLYGLNTLSVVNEGAAYTELAWGDDEETAAFVKKGNYIGVTLETFLNDKLQALRSIPTRLSAAWYNTISKLVSAVFTLNSGVGPTLGDTGALFNATALGTAGGHANLLTTALSYAALVAVRTAMRKQTDQALGAGERLNITPRYILVPADLEATAEQVRLSELVPGESGGATSGGNMQSANVMRNAFETIVVPHWTDTNDWAAAADPGQYPSIYLIWLRGRRTPEIFSAEDERGGAMFSNDELRFKTRMLTFRKSATEDCAPVADFRGLHKSNV